MRVSLFENQFAVFQVHANNKDMAERVGFEPTVGVNLHTLSKRAP